MSIKGNLEKVLGKHVNGKSLRKFLSGKILNLKGFNIQPDLMSETGTFNFLLGSNFVDKELQKIMCR